MDFKHEGLVAVARAGALNSGSIHDKRVDGLEQRLGFAKPQRPDRLRRGRNLPELGLELQVWGDGRVWLGLPRTQQSHILACHSTTGGVIRGVTPCRTQGAIPSATGQKSD